jgi:hypothetical protein
MRLLTQEEIYGGKVKVEIWRESESASPKHLNKTYGARIHNINLMYLTWFIRLLVEKSKLQYLETKSTAPSLLPYGYQLASHFSIVAK